MLRINEAVLIDLGVRGYMVLGYCLNPAGSIVLIVLSSIFLVGWICECFFGVVRYFI